MLRTFGGPPVTEAATVAGPDAIFMLAWFDVVPFDDTRGPPLFSEMAPRRIMSHLEGYTLYSKDPRFAK